MFCAICGKDGARPLELRSGEVVGDACEGRCAGLLWETDFQRKHPDDFSKHEKQMLAWEVKRQRGSKAPRPESDAEKVLTAWARSLGAE